MIDDFGIHLISAAKLSYEPGPPQPLRSPLSPYTFSTIKFSFLDSLFFPCLPTRAAIRPAGL